jgi:phosphoglycolate phosphatase
MPAEKNTERRYDLIVWDWDGTIMDSTPTIVHCIQQACRDLGFKEPDDTQVQSLVWASMILYVVQCLGLSQPIFQN